ncbi:MAG TPA: GNAT family N-acetyltransferase [Bryobacteraceae bacterium]|nr:GNAT family N-acetyltransferase [Bryobacteraceae bacterium]
MDLQVREITLADATAAASLSGELGYPTSPEVMQQRIASLSPDHVVYVAYLAGEVAGWIDVSVTHHLQSEPRAEIGGLVVASKLRSRGIGSALVARAEQWARGRGLQSVVVRSQIAREAAHNFYLREGYARTKTSAVFTKQIDRYFVSTLTT